MDERHPAKVEDAGSNPVRALGSVQSRSSNRPLSTDVGAARGPSAIPGIWGYSAFGNHDALAPRKSGFDSLCLHRSAVPMGFMFSRSEPLVAPSKRRMPRYASTMRNPKQDAYDIKRKKELVEWMRSQKVSCSECGFDNPLALDFHHREGTEKEFAVSTAAATGFSRERISAEIAKCDVLCANCHRIKHRGSIV